MRSLDSEAMKSRQQSNTRIESSCSARRREDSKARVHISARSNIRSESRPLVLSALDLQIALVIDIIFS